MGRRKPGTNRRRQGHSDRSGKAGGALWLYGAHAVAAALANPARTPGRLLATKEAADRLAAEAPGVAATPEICDRNAIESVLPKDAVHQGVALSTGPLPYTALEDITETGEDSCLLVVLDQVTDPQNVGAILRSAAVFGAAAVVLPERNAAPESGALAKAASGALEAVPLVRVSNLARALGTLKDAGFWRVGLEAGADQTIEAAPLDGRAALVMGAEGTGLRRLTREHCDLLVRLAMPANAVGSLNVSNAAAVALYEASRRQN